MTGGKVHAIFISEEKGAPKLRINQGKFVSAFGLEGDIRSGKGYRQVSLLSLESKLAINKLEKKGFCMKRFSENITTEAMDLTFLKVGMKLQIGRSIQEVTQVGKKCHEGCPLKQDQTQCVMSSIGIFTKVLVTGNVKVNDAIVIIE